jgi:hypothetical protein
MSFKPENYKFSTGEHRNKNVIFVHFQYNTLFHKELKEKFPTAKWIMSEKLLPVIPIYKLCPILNSTQQVRNCA